MTTQQRIPTFSTTREDSPIPASNRLPAGYYIEVLTGHPCQWQRFSGPLATESAAVSERDRAARIFDDARIYRLLDR